MLFVFFFCFFLTARIKLDPILVFSNIRSAFQLFVKLRFGDGDVKSYSTALYYTCNHRIGKTGRLDQSLFYIREMQKSTDLPPPAGNASLGLSDDLRFAFWTVTIRIY